MTHYPNVQYVHFYTDGSAARKLDPITPFKKKTVRLPAQKKHKRKILYVDPIAIVGICVAVCMAVLMAVGLAQYSYARAQREQMADYVRYLEQQNHTLSQEYAQAYDLNEVKRTALALGMIPKDQIESTALDISAP